MSSDKPFTETMQLDEFGIEPHNSYSYGKHVGGIALSDSAGGFTLLREEARVLYEYLKRHFEPQTKEVNREMKLGVLNRFWAYLANNRHFIPDGAIEAFLNEPSEPERQP